MDGLWPEPSEAAASVGDGLSPAWWQSAQTEWVLSGDGITAVVRQLSENHWSAEFTIEAAATYRNRKEAQAAAQAALGRLCIRRDQTLAAEF